MGRKLYYIDSYGEPRRDRKAEKAQASKPGGFSAGRTVMWVLVALAVLMVLASIH